MRTLLAAVAALLVASLAGATDYHVKPNGSDAAAGTSYAAAWRTISKANTTTRPGDVVFVWPGTYAHFPNADSAGSNPTSDGYIRWIGAGAVDPTADTLAAALVRMPVKPDATTLTSYQTWNGLWFPGFSFTEGTRSDTLRNSVVQGSLRFEGSEYCVVDNIRSTGNRVFIGTGGDYDDWIANGNEIHSSVFRNLGSGVFYGQHVVEVDHQDSLKVRFSKFFIKMEPSADDVHPWFMYHITNTNWGYNRFDVQNDAALTGAFTICIRDSSYTNMFNADTIYSAGSSGAQLGFSTSGAFPNTCYGQTIDSCTFIIRNGMGLWFQNWMDRCTITRNVVVSRDEALIANGLKGANSIDHNDFVSATDGKWTFGVVAFDGYSYGDTNSFTNNIVSSLAPGTQYISFNNEEPNSSRLSGIMLGSNINKNFIKAKWNLYGVWEYRYAPGDRSDVWWDDSGVHNGIPGGLFSGNPTAYTSAYATTIRAYGDSLSYWGSPRFADSTLTFSFDPTLLNNSLAAGLGSSGSDIGAKAYVARARAVVNPLALSFPGTAVGASDTLYFTVYNIGGDDLTIGAGVDDNDLTMIYGTSPLSAGSATTYGVIFTPTITTPRTGAITVSTNDVSHRTIIIPVDMHIRSTSSGDDGGSSEEGILRR